jgi:signal peptidase I
MTSGADTKTRDVERGGIRETLLIIFQALVLVIVFKIFLYQPFIIPSPSMVPTLLVGDYLFVSKFSYGYSKHSLPWSPDLFSGRIWAGEPKRGDVIVFKLPSDPSQDYIKRLIGLPGDKIQVKAGILHINGEPVQLRQTTDFVGKGSTCSKGDMRSEITVSRYIETLPGGVSHEILNCSTSLGDDTRVFEVPAEHYFMMGDNRDNSTDSRFDVGFVPAENLVGRAEILIFSVHEDSSLFSPWRWPAEIRWSRFFNLIR